MSSRAEYVDSAQEKCVKQHSAIDSYFELLVLPGDANQGQWQSAQSQSPVWYMFLGRNLHTQHCCYHK